MLPISKTPGVVSHSKSFDKSIKVRERHLFNHRSLCIPSQRGVSTNSKAGKYLGDSFPLACEHRVDTRSSSNVL